MIEFICLSNRPEKLQKLSASIPMAIGDLMPWKLNVVDGNQFDIFSGYNHGARQASGELLAFVHDDVQFVGNPITTAPALNALKDPRVGFVGAAGSRMLNQSGVWWGQEMTQEVVSSSRGLVGHPSNRDFGMHFNCWPLGGAVFGPVLVLDGLLLICHRRTFDMLGGFDEQNYKGFHFYDLDITLRASQKQLINVAAPILVMHDSIGATGAEWQRNREIFLKKFGNILPARFGQV